MSVLPPRGGMPPLADDQSTAKVARLLPKRCVFHVLPERGMREFRLTRELVSGVWPRDGGGEIAVASA